MFVCLCKGITDNQIKSAVLNGARSITAVRKELGVATQCCKCLPEARAIVKQTIEQHDEDLQKLPPLFYSA